MLTVDTVYVCNVQHDYFSACTVTYGMPGGTVTKFSIKTFIAKPRAVPSGSAAVLPDEAPTPFFLFLEGH